MSPIEQLRALQELFGGGLLGAIVGFVILTWVTLIAMLLRAKNAHLDTVQKLAPIADRMTDLLAETVEELHDAREVLALHKPKRRPRVQGLSPEAATVIVASPTGGGTKKDE